MNASAKLIGAFIAKIDFARGQSRFAEQGTLSSYHVIKVRMYSFKSWKLNYTAVSNQ
jgi:hypothetical protein